MFNTVKTIAATAMTVALTTSSVLAADTVKTEIQSTSPQELVVASNGVEYTNLETNGTIRVRGHFYYNTGNNGRIKSWEFWPAFSYTTNQTYFLAGSLAFRHEETYPENDRPFTVFETVNMDVPAGYLAVAAVNFCNAKADERRAAGMSNTAIFGQDRLERMIIWPRYEIELTGFNSKINDHGHYRKSLPVRCAKFDGPAVPLLGTIRPSDPATPWIQAPAGSNPDPVPNTRRPERLLPVRR